MYAFATTCDLGGISAARARHQLIVLNFEPGHDDLGHLDVLQLVAHLACDGQQFDKNDVRSVDIRKVEDGFSLGDGLVRHLRFVDVPSCFSPTKAFTIRQQDTRFERYCAVPIEHLTYTRV